MRISYDPSKRDETLANRGLDFEDAVEVFSGKTFSGVDERSDYSEVRTVTVGFLRGRMVVVVWTERGDSRRIISMRKANEREKTRARQRFESG